MLGISRHAAARRISEMTGRSETSLYAQMLKWDHRKQEPVLSSVRHLLDVLGLDLALLPRSEDVGRQRLLLSAIDNALRNGSYMTKANLAFDLLCEELGADRGDLPAFDPLEKGY